MTKNWAVAENQAWVNMPRPGTDKLARYAGTDRVKSEYIHVCYFRSLVHTDQNFPFLLNKLGYEKREKAAFVRQGIRCDKRAHC